MNALEARLHRINKGVEMGDPEDWRILTNVSMKQLRVRLRLSAQTIRQWERGVADLDIPTEQLALAYRCPSWAISQWREACWPQASRQARAA